MFNAFHRSPGAASVWPVTVLLVACALLSAMLLSGCDQESPLSFQNLDITGNTQFAKDFSLPDTNGQTRTLADYHGKIVVLLFGYTHCPDVCPTTLAELSQALDQLGPQEASRVQVLFVTVDPQRDTPAMLAQYATAFNPSFRALRPASKAQLDKVTNDFRFEYQKVPGSDASNYTMNHTAAALVFDSAGRLRLYAQDGQGVTPWVHDLGLLLQAS